MGGVLVRCSGSVIDGKNDGIIFLMRHHIRMSGQWAGCVGVNNRPLEMAAGTEES